MCSVCRRPADWSGDCEAARGRCNGAGRSRLHIRGQPAGVPRRQHRRGRDLRPSFPVRSVALHQTDATCTSAQRLWGSLRMGPSAWRVTPMCAYSALPRFTHVHTELFVPLPGVRHKGERLRSGLREAFSGNPHVKEVRGQGLICGVQLDTVTLASWACVITCVIPPCSASIG